MLVRRGVSRLSDQRGVALPMAMLALLILSALIIGFSVLAASEPTIAKNQLMVAQARAIAEAGVERAVWALNNPAHANGIPVAFTMAPVPYEGSQLLAVAAGGYTLGGFRVTVANGGATYERNVTTGGWVPSDTATGPKAQQTITVTVINPQLVMKVPPAALAVRGELRMGGTSLVDSRPDRSCGNKIGALTLREASLQGDAADVLGAAGENDTRNEVTDAGGGDIPPNPQDIVKNVAPAVFDQFILTDTDINVLRAFAKARGTYLQGSVAFDASTRMPDGLVFVDTVSGTNISMEGATPATPASDLGSVDIRGNAGSGPAGIFSGWLIVNGGLSISGNFQMNGFIYAQNNLSYQGTGAGGISGAVVSRNIRDLSSGISSGPLGQASITFNCNHATTGGGTIPSRWSMKRGTYREVAGP